MNCILPEDIWWFHIVPFIKFEDIVNAHNYMWNYPKKPLNLHSVVKSLLVCSAAIELNPKNIKNIKIYIILGIFLIKLPS